MSADSNAPLILRHPTNQAVPDSDPIPPPRSGNPYAVNVYLRSFIYKNKNISWEQAGTEAAKFDYAADALYLQSESKWVELYGALGTSLYNDIQSSYYGRVSLYNLL